MNLWMAEEMPSIEIIFEVVMGVFSLTLLWSYGVLAISRGVRNKIHISCMIWSYLILILLILTYDPYRYDDWRVWPLGTALVLGWIGLVEYYRNAFWSGQP